MVTVSGAAAVREVLTRDEFDGRPDGFFFRLRTFGKRLGNTHFFTSSFYNSKVTLVNIFLFKSYGVIFSKLQSLVEVMKRNYLKQSANWLFYKICDLESYTCTHQ